MDVVLMANAGMVQDDAVGNFDVGTDFGVVAYEDRTPDERVGTDPNILPEDHQSGE